MCCCGKCKYWREVPHISAIGICKVLITMCENELTQFVTKTGKFGTILDVLLRISKLGTPSIFGKTQWDTIVKTTTSTKPYPNWIVTLVFFSTRHYLL